MSHDGSIVMPVPMPTSMRPCEMWSSVSACRASIAGFRSGICATQLVRRIVCVAAASPVSAVQDSNHGPAGWA